MTMSILLLALIGLLIFFMFPFRFLSTPPEQTSIPKMLILHEGRKKEILDIFLQQKSVFWSLEMFFLLGVRWAHELMHR